MLNQNASKVTKSSGVERSASSGSDWIGPPIVEREYGPKVSTQAVWRHTNRHGFRDLARKCGSRIVYRRSAIENWLEARTLDASDREAAA